MSSKCFRLLSNQDVLDDDVAFDEKDQEGAAGREEEFNSAKNVRAGIPKASLGGATPLVQQAKTSREKIAPPSSKPGVLSSKLFPDWRKALSAVLPENRGNSSGNSSRSKVCRFYSVPEVYQRLYVLVHHSTAGDSR